MIRQVPYIFSRSTTVPFCVLFFPRKLLSFAYCERWETNVLLCTITSVAKIIALFHGRNTSLVICFGIYTSKIFVVSSVRTLFDQRKLFILSWFQDGICLQWNVNFSVIVQRWVAFFRQTIQVLAFIKKIDWNSTKLITK